jgi:hypothetical protein
MDRWDIVKMVVFGNVSGGKAAAGCLSQFLNARDSISCRVCKALGFGASFGKKAGPHTAQSDTTRCGVSRVGHAAKRPDFTEATPTLLLPAVAPLACHWTTTHVAIVKKRKELNKERKERFGGRAVLENGLSQK